jgi:hypothetical protein
MLSTLQTVKHASLLDSENGRGHGDTRTYR